jgi:hypothetical protein
MLTALTLWVDRTFVHRNKVFYNTPMSETAIILAYISAEEVVCKVYHKHMNVSSDIMYKKDLYVQLY